MSGFEKAAVHRELKKAVFDFRWWIYLVVLIVQKKKNMVMEDFAKHASSESC